VFTFAMGTDPPWRMEGRVPAAPKRKKPKVAVVSEPSVYLTAAQIAAELGVSMSQAFALMKRMPRLKIGRSVRVSRMDFHRFLSVHTLEPPCGSIDAGKVYWLQCRGTRRSLHTSDRQAAELAAREVQRREADPHYATATEARLKTWVGKVLDAKRTHRSAGTVNMHECKSGHLIRIFGEDARLAVITPETVDSYVKTRLAEDAASYTVQKELVSLVQTLKMAKRAGAYSGDLSVLKPADFSIGYKPRETILLPRDEVKLRAACAPEQWAAVALILGSACRLSEALAVRKEDLNWSRRELRIRGTKTEASDALIPIVDRCGMAKYLREAEPHLPITWARMSKTLPEICEQAKITRVTPNDLRRTAATRLIESGLDAYTVSKITRHTTLTMLKSVYDRASVAAVRKLIDGPGRKASGTKPVQAPSGKPKKSAKRSAKSSTISTGAEGET
jgi:integrase